MSTSDTLNTRAHSYRRSKELTSPRKRNVKSMAKNTEHASADEEGEQYSSKHEAQSGSPQPEEEKSEYLLESYEVSDNDDDDRAPLINDSEDEYVIEYTNNREMGEDENANGKKTEEDETSCSIGMQVVLPYIVAGFGMVAAGIVLDVVQVSWLTIFRR